MTIKAQAGPAPGLPPFERSQGEATGESRPVAGDYKYDFMVFIGRFRFFHEGHRAVIRRALELGRRVIVLVGSCRQPRTPRNPLTFEEVSGNILDAFPQDMRGRIILRGLMDRYNDVEWCADVQAAVGGVIAQFHMPADGPAPKVCLIGHSKDRTSYYLHRFPQWSAEAVENFRAVSATPIREDYFRDAGAALAKWADCLPSNVVEFLREFAHTPEYGKLAEEAAYLRAFKERWLGSKKPFREAYFEDAEKAIAEEGENLRPEAIDFLRSFAKTEAYRRLADESSLVKQVRPCWTGAPYPPLFHTVDAVVLQAGHILLIERRGLPGKGLLALPGGYVDEHERIQESMLRELREETRLEIPASVVAGAIEARRDFDHPYRSARGRVITTAFLVQLAPAGQGLPEVRGGDDAERAFWLPLNEVEPERMFEDHYHIIQTMVPLATV